MHIPPLIDGIRVLAVFSGTIKNRLQEEVERAAPQP